MTETKYSRKLDTMGRLMIPIRLREEMHLNIGQEYVFYTHEENGRKFIAIECPTSATEIEKAKQFLESVGYSIEQN